MDAPAQSAEPRSTRRGWLRFALRGVLIGFLCAFAGEAGRVFVGSNFHTVEPGRFYRSSQPSPEELEQLIRKHGIRTVVNLRGCCSSFDWYLDECRTSAKLDVCQEDLCFSAGRLPSVPEVRRLVEVLDHCEYPVLFHCQRGADRTGLASAMGLLLHSDLPYDTARRQLGLRYGHIALSRPAKLDYFFDLYQEWLDREGLTHSRDHFRRWVMNDYCAGEGRAEIVPLDIPATVPAGEPFAARVRIRNLSIKPWHMHQAVTSGVHVSFIVLNSRAVTKTVGRAGLFDAVVGPGESMEVTLPVPGVREAGHYTLEVDVMDERHCTFFQTGSEPLEWEFEVRE